jgi:hypothetical protein
LPVSFGRAMVCQRRSLQFEPDSQLCKQGETDWLPSIKRRLRASEDYGFVYRSTPVYRRLEVIVVESYCRCFAVQGLIAVAISQRLSPVGTSG